jgi:hypothetical protein
MPRFVARIKPRTACLKDTKDRESLRRDTENGGVQPARKEFR